MRKTENKTRLAKCIADINSSIEKATAEKEKQITFFTGEIEALKQTIEDETEKRNEAANKNDTAGFRAAAKNIAAAEVEKKQYEESMAVIQKRPVISLEQAGKFMEELQYIQKTISNDATAEVSKYVTEIRAIDKEAMKLQDDLITFAQLLADQAQGMIVSSGAELTCNGARVATIIGATNKYPWRLIAELLKKQAGVLDYEG